jgi:hypothetical protein
VVQRLKIAMLDPKSPPEAAHSAVCVLCFLPSDLRGAERTGDRQGAHCTPSRLSTVYRLLWAFMDRLLGGVLATALVSATAYVGDPSSFVALSGQLDRFSIGAAASTYKQQPFAEASDRSQRVIVHAADARCGTSRIGRLR